MNHIIYHPNSFWRVYSDKSGDNFFLSPTSTFADDLVGFRDIFFVIQELYLGVRGHREPLILTLASSFSSW